MGDATRLLQTHWTVSHLPSLHLTTLLTGTAAQRPGSGAGRQSNDSLKLAEPSPVACNPCWAAPMLESPCQPDAAHAELRWVGCLSGKFALYLSHLKPALGWLLIQKIENDDACDGPDGHEKQEQVSDKHNQSFYAA